jgi:hypothetical protein
MDTRFDQISKVLSSNVSRRTAFKFVGASVLGAMLSTIGVKQAEAVGQRACRDAGDPACTETTCHGTADSSCGCIPKVRNGVPTGKGMCHQGIPCAGITACNTHRDCRLALGANWKCSSSCCGVGFCHPKCGTVAGGALSGKTSLGG